VMRSFFRQFILIVRLDVPFMIAVLYFSFGPFLSIAIFWTYLNLGIFRAS
jgi:hypothetical protein